MASTSGAPPAGANRGGGRRDCPAPTAEEGERRARNFIRLLTEGDGFDRVLRALEPLTCPQPGAVRAAFTVAREHTNRYGTLHGGLQATLVDVVGTAALVTLPWQSVGGVTTDLSVSCLAGVALGERVIVDAEVLHEGKQLACVRVRLSRQRDGKLCMEGRHSKYVAYRLGASGASKRLAEGPRSNL